MCTHSADMASCTTFVYAKGLDMENEHKHTQFKLYYYLITSGALERSIKRSTDLKWLLAESRCTVDP